MNEQMRDYFSDIVNHENLGAGNFVKVLMDIKPDIQTETVFLDEAVVIPGVGEKRALSVSDINTWSNCWSAWYEGQGITPKDTVGLYLEDDVNYLIHYVAITRIGAVPVHVNGGLDPVIACKFMQRVDTKIVMCSLAKEPWLRPALNTEIDFSAELFVADHIELTPGAVPVYVHNHQAKDPVMIAHTSGTTGIPKGVRFNHDGFIFGVKKELHKQVGQRIMSALPHSHASAISIIMSSMLRGVWLKVQQNKAPKELLDEIAQFKPDMFVSFPKVYVDLCRLDLDQYELSSINYWLSTGDANHEPHIKKLLQYGTHNYKGETRQGSVFIDNLGSSEFGFAAFRNMHKIGTNNYDRCIGKPFDWVDAAILDEEGNELAANEVGLLGVRSETITDGYWNNTSLSEKNRLGGYWLTGDLAFKDDREVYYHVDRTTDVINTIEGPLYSCQTEEFLIKRLPEIFDCSIYGVKAKNSFDLPVIEIELNYPVQTHGLLEKINSILTKAGKPKIEDVKVVSPGTNVGVTGKKLKRVLRETTTVSA